MKSSGTMLCAATPAIIARARGTGECRFGEAERRPNRRQAEPGLQDRPSPAERREQCVHQLVRPRDPGIDQTPVRRGIRRPEAHRRRLDRSFHDDRGAIVERMRERRLRVHEGHAVIGERQRREERRRLRQCVNRGAHVVRDAGLGEFSRSNAAADRRFRLVEADAKACPCQRDRGRQAVRAGADHDSVEVSASERRRGRHRLKGYS